MVAVRITALSLPPPCSLHSSQSPECHVVAVRITAEDASDGFKPTCGRIDEVHFRPTPEVWGYFSVKSGGGIHEYSDSQVGGAGGEGGRLPSGARERQEQTGEAKGAA